MFTFFTLLPPELIRYTLSTFIPTKQIYGRYRGLDKARKKEAILNLCLQQSRDHLFYQTLIFADPTSAQLFETEEEIKALQNAIEASIALPFSTLEHQLGGKLFLTKLRLPDFSLSDDMIPNILALFDKSPNTLQILLPYTEMSTQENIMSEVAKKLTNGIDFKNIEAAEWNKSNAIERLESLESVISQLDNTTMHYPYLIPILTDAVNYTGYDMQAVVACRILATLFLQANNTRRLEIISTVVTAVRKSTSREPHLEAIKTFAGFLSQTKNEEERSSIISALLDKKMSGKNHYGIVRCAAWEVLASVL